MSRLSICTSDRALAAVGNFKSIPFSSSGVVMTKMISNTNARSSSGVMLMSLSVTSELRCEKRLMESKVESRRSKVAERRRFHVLRLSAFDFRLFSFFQIFSFHFGNHFLRKVVQLDRQHAQ